MIYLSNAFSLQMLSSFPSQISVSEVSREDVPVDAISAIGHADLACLLSVECNRINVKLSSNDTLYVAQLVGGRLPEGTTRLPDGFTIKFFKISIA